MQAVRILFSFILIFIAHYSYDYLNNRPYSIETELPSGKLKSVSFAPYREGFSPVNEKFPLPEHIDGDLKLLAGKTESIRTYTSRGGMEPTPDFAGKYGINIIQGAWLVDDHSKNQIEIQALIKSANDHPEVVKRVIVGNEVMLHHYMDVKQLIGYIRQVKSAIKQPVSYADVWSMYLKYPELIKEVDFITIHILPYWEDEPVSVENALEHLEKIFKQVEDIANGIAPGKPILIGESGWPAIGRQRGQAAPSVINAARYINGLADVATRHGFDYNVVEAFNQSWKSREEGVVGANWGLFSVDRKPVFPLSGLVYEKPDWPKHFAWATILWLLAVAAYFKKLPLASLTKLLVFLGLAQILCASLVTMADFLWSTSYSTLQRAYTLSIVIANLVIGALLIRRYHDMLSDSFESETLAKWLRNGYLFFIVLAVYKTFHIAIDGGELSFPGQQFVILTVGIIGMILCEWLRTGKLKKDSLTIYKLIGCKQPFFHYGGVAYLLTLAMLALVFGETRYFMGGRDLISAHPGFFNALPFALKYTLYNRQLLLWLASLFLLSLPFWFSRNYKDKA